MDLPRSFPVTPLLLDPASVDRPPEAVNEANREGKAVKSDT